MEQPDGSTLSVEAMLAAREAARAVLEAIGLRNYRFDVEPHARGSFEVRVEHERDGAWHDVTLREPAQLLLAHARDARAREELARRWRRRLIGAPSGREDTGH